MPARHRKNINTNHDSGENDSGPSGTADSKIANKFNDSTIESIEDTDLKELTQSTIDPINTGTDKFPTDVDSSSTTPPPVPRRRNMRIAPELPPKLPTKPPKQTTQTDGLHNQKM